MNRNSDFNDLFREFFGSNNGTSKMPGQPQSAPEIKSPIVPESAKTPPPAPLPQVDPLPAAVNHQPPLPRQNQVPPSHNPTQPPPSLRQEVINREEGRAITGAGTAVTMSPNPELLIPRSMEVDEILSYVPNWMIRWGITVIFILLICIIGMSYVIKYPDITEGQIRLISETPPVEVVSKSSGPFGIFKKDKSTVKKGQAFAMIKNDAVLEDVKTLKKLVKKIDAKLEESGSFNNFNFPTNLNLGILQNAYSELEYSLQNRQLQSQSAGNNDKRKGNIRKQLVQMKKIQTEYEERVDLLKDGYERSEAVLEGRYKSLYRKGSISREQYDQKEDELNRKYNELQMAKSNLSEHKKRIIDITVQLDELDFEKNKNDLSGINAIRLAVKKVKNEILAWENLYILRAPIDGRLNYLQFVKNDLHIDGNQTIASIAPISEKDNTKGLEGEMLIPADKSADVEIGQEVNVKLAAFKEKEYGILIGKVKEMSDVQTTIKRPEGSMKFYKIRVEFENGLTTTLKKQIDFRHGLEGEGEIITKDKRLLERIFYELRGALDFI